ncbi:uncharacterized protein LOC144545702 [Carex rostrata]
MTGGKEKWSFQEIWEVKAPQTVKIFGYLLLQNRILTRDVLRRRHISCPTECVLCSTGEQETAMHLFFQCEYARRVWLMAGGRFGYHLITIDQDVRTSWRRSWNRFKSRGLHVSKFISACFVSICWHIWLQRNNLIFRDNKIPPEIIAVRALDVGRMWAENC